MVAKFLSNEEIINIVNGRCDDPFAFLGFHKLDNKKKSAVIRTFQPFAKEIELIAKDTPMEIPMERIHKDGLFEIFVPEDTTNYKFLITDFDGNESMVDDVYSFPAIIGEFDNYLLREGNHFELYKKMGAQLTSLNGVDGVSFAVWAPDAYRVSVVGEFNHWDGRIHVMRKHPVSGIWDIFIPHLTEGTLYKFELISKEGRLLPLKSDPYGFYQELRPHTASIVWDRKKYKWSTNKKWDEEKHTINSNSAPISIYEAHLGSWKRKDGNQYLSYRELAHDLIPYVKWMGFTHIELMPIMEYPFDGSWGYQTTGMFAPTSRFGNPDDFKYFVEQAHNAGLGVILDWVAAHFPKDSNGLALFDGRPLYEYADDRKGEHKDWGTKIYDYGRNEVVNFLIASATYWLDEFKVDGLRFDAVASMLYLDYSRRAGEWVPNIYGGRENLEAISFLQKVNTIMYGKFPYSASYAEESTGWGNVSKPVDVGGLGFGYKWNMGWMHDVLDYMSKEPIYRKYHHYQMTHCIMYAFTENFVLSISHDEVVHCKASLINKMPGDKWQKFANLRAFYGYMWAFPGRKLIFQGDEFAQYNEWNENQSLDWHITVDPYNKSIQKLIRRLNELYRTEHALYDNNSHPSCFEWINYNDAENSVFSFIRHSDNPEDYLVVVSNMTPIVRENYRLGVPFETEFTELLNTDDFEYMGSGVKNEGVIKTENIRWDDKPFSINITIPPLATIILKPKQK